MLAPERSPARIRATSRLVFGLLIACAPAVGFAATFSVNSPADVLDASPGDGFCRTAPDNTVCTLRAAIQESNALAGVDTINLQANATYTLTRFGANTELNGDLDVIDSVNIVGAGPASTIIDANGGTTAERAMEIFHCIGNVPIVNGVCPDGDIVAVVSGVGFRNGQRIGNSGGAIWSVGRLTLENCALTGNTVTVFGGAIFSTGPLTLSNSTVAGNSGGGVGGGVYLSSSNAIIIGSTISGNQTLDRGGGVYVTSGSTVALINSTISGNSSNGSGGGLSVFGTTTVGLYNVTIARNTANADDTGVGTGGGMLAESGASVTLANSIVSGNIHRNEGSQFDTLDDCVGSFVSQGNNLVTVFTATCMIAGPTSFTGPLLGPLQNNGGPTLTIAPQTGSVAIDGGNPAGCTDNLGAFITTDQRGEPRPVGPACDIGALERGDALFGDGFES